MAKSTKSNVHPAHYKTAGRERPGEDIIHDVHKQEYAQARAHEESVIVSGPPASTLSIPLSTGAAEGRLGGLESIIRERLNPEAGVGLEEEVITDVSMCEVCGNTYDKAFKVIMAGDSHVFDSFECAIAALAPSCDHCGCRIIGHGVEAEGSFFCCAHCAKRVGVDELKDRA